MDNTTNNRGAPSNGTPPTPRSNSNSAQDQRKRLLDYLQAYVTIDTITARRDLDIMMPGARVHELRHRFGHAIDCVFHANWTASPRQSGQSERSDAGVMVLL